MRSDEIQAQIRQSCYIGDATAFPEYTDAKLRAQATDKLQSVFEDIVVKCRAGYWLHQRQQTLTVGTQRYRIPPRAVVGGVESIEIYLNNRWQKLLEESSDESLDYEDGTTGDPERFTIVGDQVWLFPIPATARTIRWKYYLRPSELQQSQCSTLGGDGVERGRVTAVNTSTLTVTVNAVPYDQSLAAPAAIISANQSIDIVHPDGWHELALVGSTQMLSGTTFTLPAGTDMSDIAVGDYVRAADQTDWPCLPDDFHRLLCDVTAVKIMMELSLEDKAAAMSQALMADLERFRSILLPRVKSQPARIPLRPYSRR
jgi:hypothetical protein